MMENDKNTEKDARMPYLRVRSATKLMILGDTGSVTTYIYGVTGTGKTMMVRNFLANRKYYELDAAVMTEEQLLFQPVSDKRKIVVIENLHELPFDHYECMKARIVDLMEREDVWLILVSRSPVPPWLIEIRLRCEMNVIDESKLLFTRELSEKYMEKTQMLFDEEQKEIVQEKIGGYPFVWALAAVCYREKTDGRPRILDKQEFIAYTTEVEMKCYQYLEHHVYDRWEVNIQEFLTEISIVDVFTEEMARYITGRADLSRLLERIRWRGNFLNVSLTKDKRYLYALKPGMRKSINMRLHRKYKKERIRNLYVNAGMYYRIHNQPVKALQMYEAVDARDRIIDMLEDNARMAPGKAYFYELREYYLDLSEEEVLESPYLMEGMCMLQALLLNPEESEKWYTALSEYGRDQKGSKKKDIRSRLLYLDLALLHRGSVDFVTLLKNANTLLGKREVALTEFTITSNLPSILNGGKDLTDLTKNDRELAGSIGKVLEAVFGKHGKSLVNLGLAESLLEKGGDSFEIASYVARGRMQAESMGNMEQVFVADGILAWLHVINGQADIAKEIMENFVSKAMMQDNEKIIANAKTLLARIALYQEDIKTVNHWLLNAPNEDLGFNVYDRFHYLTKARVYLLTGKKQMAYQLLMKLSYYTEVAGRKYMGMEVKLLQAMILYRGGNSKWDDIFKEVLDFACGYHFIRLVSREGSGVIKLLRETTWGTDVGDGKRTYTKDEKNFLKELMKETEEMTHAYPGYLKEGQEEIVLCDNARKILKYLEHGAKQSVIMEELGLSKSNVKYHISQIYRKLNVKNRTEAVTEARKLGLL